MKPFLYFAIIAILVGACKFAKPPEKEARLTEKHNYIILLDLSDRLIVQENQPERDKELIQYIYSLFEKKVRNELYIRSRDEIKVVIAPQQGDNLYTNLYEDKLYVNMENIENIYKRANEAERKEQFMAYLDTLYREAQFSSNPKDYYGADIWKYFYEDLPTDYSGDTLTNNYLFILTDGYPVVGNDPEKLKPVKHEISDLHIVLLEAAPRQEDMEWDHVREIWASWFDSMGVENYTFVKRKAISKEKEEIKEIIGL